MIYRFLRRMYAGGFVVALVCWHSWQANVMLLDAGPCLNLCMIRFQLSVSSQLGINIALKIIPYNFFQRLFQWLSCSWDIFLVLSWGFFHALVWQWDITGCQTKQLGSDRTGNHPLANCSCLKVQFTRGAFSVYQLVMTHFLLSTNFLLKKSLFEVFHQATHPFVKGGHRWHHSLQARGCRVAGAGGLQHLDSQEVVFLCPPITVLLREDEM